MKDICASCGSELRYKHEVEETTSQKIKDRTQGLEVIAYLQNFMKELDGLPFPSKPTLTAFMINPVVEQEVVEKKAKRDNDSDIDENLMKFIDYDLKYIKLSKNFFKKSKKEDYYMGNMAKFSDTLKNVRKEVKAYFRVQDLKACVLKSTGSHRRAIAVEAMKKQKQSYSKLNPEAYRRLYNERMSGKINLN
jgi:hypothetical protein